VTDARRQETTRVSRLRLARAIEEAALPPGDPHPCSYLPGRTARAVAFLPGPLPPGVYHGLMDLNFRRSGRIFYRPSCGGCRECRAIRVPVARFEADRSQRRCRRRNRDLSVEVGRPVPTREKHALYARYLRARHGGEMDRSWEEFRSFLYQSPIETWEVVYRLGERLMAVAILDEEPEALSTVYCYFDPDERARGLGVFNVLWTLEHARARGIPYVYLGYYVAGSATMSYKADFRPHGLLEDGARWAEAEPLRRRERGVTGRPRAGNGVPPATAGA
jgi:arginine-tRNA-protein transferase